MTQIVVSVKEKPSWARDACAPMCLAALSPWTQLVLVLRYSGSSLAVIFSGLSHSSGASVPGQRLRSGRGGKSTKS